MALGWVGKDWLSLGSGTEQASWDRPPALPLPQGDGSGLLGLRDGREVRRAPLWKAEHGVVAELTGEPLCWA